MSGAREGDDSGESGGDGGSTKGGGDDGAGGDGGVTSGGGSVGGGGVAVAVARAVACSAAWLAVGRAAAADASAGVAAMPWLTLTDAAASDVAASEPVLTRYSRQAESMGPPHATATFHSIGRLSEVRPRPGVEGVNYRCGSVAPVCEGRARRRQDRAHTSSEPVLTRYSRQAESMGPPHATATFHSIGTLGGLGAAGASRASTTDANPFRLYAKTAPVDGKLAHTRAPSPS